MMSARSLFVSVSRVGVALALGGCDLAPRYKAPSAETGGSFKEAVIAESGANQGWKLAEPRDTEWRGRWWMAYGDRQLNELEEWVAISNQTIAAAEANYRAARALANEARASLFPSVGLDPSVIRSRSSAATVSSGSGSSGGASSGGTGSSSGGGGTGPRTYFTLPVEASYEIDLWGSVRNAYAQASHAAEASASQVATAILSTQATLAQDYFSLRAADEQRRILDTTLADYEASLHLVRALYNNGLASEEDMAEADTQLDSAEAQATDLGIARSQLEHAIAVLIGVPPSKFSLAVEPFRTRVPVIPVGLPSDLLERRPDVSATEREVAAANAEIGVARAAFFPTLTISGTFGAESTNLTHLLDWPNRFWSIGPTLAQSLFEGGLRQAATAQAWAAYDQAVANYRQTVLAACQSVEDDLSGLRILSKEVGQQHKATVAAEHSVQLSVVRYQNGLDSYVNVITAQNTFLSNRLAELQVELRRLTSSIALVNNLGGGWSTEQLKATEDQAQKHAAGRSIAEAPAENAVSVPNPPPLPAATKNPEDLLKQDEQSIAPQPTH
jgi:NodT family efflux transporter outer membrane factor (OMF) lipoprotein